PARTATKNLPSPWCREEGTVAGRPGKNVRHTGYDAPTGVCADRLYSIKSSSRLSAAGSFWHVRNVPRRPGDGIQEHVALQRPRSAISSARGRPLTRI